MHPVRHVDESKHEGKVDVAKAVAFTREACDNIEAGHVHLYDVQQFHLDGKVARLFLTDK